MTIRPRYTVRARSLRAGRLDGAGQSRRQVVAMAGRSHLPRSRCDLDNYKHHTSLGTAQAAAYNCILIYYRTLIMRSFWSRPSNNGVSFRGKAVESRRMAVHFCRFSLRRVERSKKRQSAANCTLVKGSRLISPRGIFAMMFNWRDEER